jgi:hypothetical protein
MASYPMLPGYFDLRRILDIADAGHELRTARMKGTSGRALVRARHRPGNRLDFLAVAFT